jgi:serine protease Do
MNMNLLKQRRLARSVILLVCVAMTGMLSAETDANGVETLRQASRAFSQVAKKATPAVVAVQVESVVRTSGGYMGSPFDDEFFDRFFGPRPRGGRAPREQRRVGQASGFIISEDGYVLTNHHVIDGADTIRIKMGDGRTFEGVEVVGSDDKADVAVLKIKDAQGLPFLELGDSDDLEVGEWVVAIGNPFGLTETLTVGVVSAKGRRVSQRGEDVYQDFIQTDAAINPGNSGGPLLNLDAKVVGINSAIISGSGGYMGVGLAVPISMATLIKDQLIATGRVERGYIGISMQDVTPELADYFKLKSRNGVLVMDVEKDSPSEKAGLKKDDVIVRLNGRTITDGNDIRNMIGFTAPGSDVEVTVIRGGKERTITITVGAREESVAAQTGEIGRKLGLTVQTIDAEVARQYNLAEGQGVRVEAVESGSTAENAGIQPNMVITSVNRKEVKSVAEFNEALKESEQSKQVLLLVRTGRFSRYVLLRLP